VTSDRLRILVGALVLACMAGFVALRLQLSTELAQFLDHGTERELAAVSRQLMDASPTRTMILSIEAQDRARSLEAARVLESELRAHPEIASVRAGPPAGMAEAVYALYFPHRLAFLSSQPERELPARLSDAGLADAAGELKRQLSLPLAGLIQRVAREDPLLAFPSILARLEQAQEGSLEIVDGRFVAGRGALLFVETRHSAFDSAAQGPLEEHLQASFAELDRSTVGGVRIRRSGAHRFAAASAQRAQSEAGLISSVSLVAIVLLFALVFRSLRLLLVAFVPLLAGMLAAVSVGLLLFGQLHVLTLAFGSTLIGVCIDYPVHLLTHYALEPRAGGVDRVLRRVSAALLMGALTTVAGFGGIAWSGFPGVREVGIFSGVGVLAALAATFVLVPPLTPVGVRMPPLAKRWAHALRSSVAWLDARRRMLWVVPALGVALLVVGLPRVVWLDDVFELNVPAEPGWLEEEQAVRSLVSRMDSGRFVVALADDTEAALALNDRLFVRLEEARSRGLLKDFQSLHRFLFSAELQRRNLEVLVTSPALAPRLERALSQQGFRAAAFAPFETAVESSPAEPLRLDDLKRSPLRDLVTTFHVELEDRVAILTLVREVEDPAALAAALDDLEDVHFFDQRTFLSELYARYRERTLELLAAGFLAVTVLLVIRYRSLVLGLVVVTPATLASLGTLAVLAIAGTPINLLHMLGLIMVLSIGVDYSIFLMEERQGEHVSGTLLGMAIAGISEILGFGLLAFSSFPALSALGSTATIGVLGCLALSPAVLLVGRPTGLRREIPKVDDPEIGEAGAA